MTMTMTMTMTMATCVSRPEKRAPRTGVSPVDQSIASQQEVNHRSVALSEKNIIIVILVIVKIIIVVMIINTLRHDEVVDSPQHQQPKTSLGQSLLAQSPGGWLQLSLLIVHLLGVSIHKHFFKSVYLFKCFSNVW